jgi:protoheme IX farnesyltransferase
MVLVEQLSATARLDWRALVALAKPRLSLLVIFTTGAGLQLAPGHLSPWRSVGILLASSAVVGAANALNSYLERDVDARMRRTCQRPLPQGRMEPQVALILASLVGIFAIGALYLLANPLTALLSFVALALYAWVYTPMKQISSWAMLVGAVPGAIPPLMGYAAVSGELTAAAWSLFGLLFFWQLPHFLAVSTYLKDDYARGGIRVLPRFCSPRATVWWTLAAALAVLPASLWPVQAGLGGRLYVVVAVLSGGLFCGATAAGLRQKVEPGTWARQIFLLSIAYLCVLLVSLLVSHAS